jgi:hypothetical protein
MMRGERFHPAKCAGWSRGCGEKGRKSAIKRKIQERAGQAPPRQRQDRIKRGRNELRHYKGKIEERALVQKQI